MSKRDWKTVIEFEDITYKKCGGVARIAFNRPEVRNAFRPKTVSELLKAFYDVRDDNSVRVVLLKMECMLFVAEATKVLEENKDMLEEMVFID
jgi:naphthoate synthase